MKREVVMRICVHGPVQVVHGGGPVRPDQVRSSISVSRARRIRRHRYSVLGTVTAAAAVVLVVGVPAVVLHKPTAGPVISASPAPNGKTRLYHPTVALPDGLNLHAVLITLSGSMAVPEHPKSIERIWDRPGTDPRPPGSDVKLTVLSSTDAGYPTSGFPSAGQGEPIEVSGHAGRYNPGNGPTVAWRVDGETVLAFTGQGGMAKEELLRIAGSVEPDSEAVRFPMRFGWLPVGLSPTDADIAGTSRSDWSAGLSAYGAKVAVTPPESGRVDAVAPWVDVTLSSMSQRPYVPVGGDAVTVRGHPARIVTSEDRSDPRTKLVQRWLTIDMGQEVVLTISASAPESHPISAADLLNVAEHLSVDSDPDLSWIGTR